MNYTLELLAVLTSLYILSMGIFGYDMTEYRKIPDVIFRQHDEVIENTFICVKACIKNRPCLSFAFDKSSQSCYLYNRILFNGEGETVDNQIGSNTYTLNAGYRNVALWKPTKQTGHVYSWTSEKAVDGDRNTGIHTATDVGLSWWCVDLQSHYDVAWVTIWNFHLHQDRLANFHLHLATNTPCSQENLQSATLCYVNDGTTKPVYTVVECNQPSVSLKNVQSLYITLQDKLLHFSEVEISADEATKTCD